MNKTFQRTNLYLGLFLVLLGITFLLDNLGIVRVDKNQLLRLWPFILIVWGLKYIPMSRNMRFWVNIFLIFLFYALLLFGRPRQSFWDRMKDKYVTVTETDDEGEAVADHSAGKDYYFMAEKTPGLEKASVELSIGAAEFIIENPTDQLFEFIGENIPYELEKVVSIHGKRADIKIIPKGKNYSVKLKDFNDISMEMKLNPDVVWDFDLEAGAAAVEMDLKAFKIENMDIKTGAADMEIILGDKHPVTHITIRAGASNVRLYVPENAAVELKLANVLSAGTYPGLEKVEKNLYRTKQFQSTQPKIYIQIQSALTNFELERY